MITNHIRLSILVFLLTAGPGWAQSWTFGPRVRLPLSLNTTNQSITIPAGGKLRTDLSLGEVGETTPAQWAAFARHDRNRFFAQAELLTGNFNMGGYVNDERGNGFSFNFRSRMVGTNVVAGVKPLPWLRLYGGGGYQHHAWVKDDHERIANFIENRINSGGINGVQNPSDPGDLRSYRTLVALNNAYRNHVLTGQVGVGVDIGGLTLDLTYQRSLTPLLDGIPTATTTLPARQQYGSYGLGLGYRLLPLKAHLLAPRRNRGYERIKRDIPFYRNEFHVAVGLLGEDIGSAFLYENRYTRYLTRRFGVTGGLNVVRVFETFENGFLPNHYNTFQWLTGVRVLPLYSRRHTIGLSAGPTLTYESGVRAFTGGLGRVTPTGFRYNSVNWRADSYINRLTLSWQTTLDYHVAATDRLLVGPWLRVNGLDYATFGIQTGYRF